MNLRFVGHLVGLVIVVVGAGILVSAVVSAIYGDPDVIHLIVSAAIAFAVGTPLFFATRLRGETNIGYREGFLSVGLGWIVAMVFGAVPYVVWGVFGPVDALFESMSGFTTTGASVLTDYAQPHGLLFWRSLSHWFGGMGIIVLFTPSSARWARGPCGSSRRSRRGRHRSGSLPGSGTRPVTYGLYTPV